MASYKVLQDIESEDKLLGPFTLKQFIFLAITLGIGFVEFKLLTLTGLGFARWLVMFVFFIPMLVFGFLAAPISRDQPNDIWLIARLRYLIKPHKRIWDQAGISQLVSINVPKREEEIYTNGLSENEVKSRLTALANTLDSRGWAVKNVDLNLYSKPGFLTSDDNSQRLIDPSSLPVDVPTADISASDDILDAQSNPVAQHLDEMVTAAEQHHRQAVLEKVKQGSQPQAQADNYWFMNQQPAATAPAGFSSIVDNPVISPSASQPPITASAQPTAEEQALIAAKLQEQKAQVDTYNAHLKNIKPIHNLHDDQAAPTVASPPVADPAQNSGQTANDQRQATSNPAILKLASNDDLNVATIARQAKKMTGDDDEVVISLH